MTREEIAAQLDKIRTDTEAALDKLHVQIQVEVECANGWALQALSTDLTDRLRLLAKDYDVEVTDDVIRGVWLASQLVLDVDPDTMLGDD